jgi:uncharacterized repeat protein (TIGR01451 family)
MGPPAGPLVAQATVADGNTAWGFHAGVYTVPPGQTTTRFEFDSVSAAGGDPLFGNFLDDVAFGTPPCLELEKAATPAGPTVAPGTEVTVRLTARNTGGNPAERVVLTDTLPAGLAYVPGSLAGVAGPGAGALTDAAGDDTGEADAATGQVTVRLGAGATAAAGGAVESTAALPGGVAVEFRAVVLGTVATATNRAAVAFQEGVIEPPATGRFTAESNPVALGVAATVTPTATGTATETGTPTATATATAAPTATPSSTATAALTATPSATGTPTPTPTPTESPTATPTPTGTPGAVAPVDTPSAPAATATPTTSPTPDPGGPRSAPEAPAAGSDDRSDGGGGGGPEPQDVLICEALPGGPREVRITASEWPRYRSRAVRGPCAGAPAGGPGAAAAAAAPAAVPGAAGTLPPGPPPASGGAAAPRLERASRVRVTLLGARTNLCDGDLVLLAPPLAGTPVPDGPNADLPAGARRLWAGYLHHLGEWTDLGPYPAGAELILGLAPGGFCATGAPPRPSTGAAARVAQPGPGVWDVWWEDLPPDGDADYDDLVVRIEVFP